jgi:Lipid II flippase MurJ
VSDAHQDVRHGVVRAVGSIGLATLLSRILGFIRDMVVARAFGAGPVTDAFFVAFRIPNLLRRLLAEGALSTAFIPVFTSSLTHDGRAGFRKMLRAVTGATGLALCVVSALGMIAAPWIVRVMAPGWSSDPAQIGLASDLTRLMFPYLILVGLASLGMAALNAHHRFFTAALVGPAVLNVAMILAVLLLAARVAPPILSLGFGVLVGGAGQFLIQLPELRRLGLPLWPSAEWKHPAVRMIAGRMWPAVFALAAVQVTVLVNTLLASLLPQGTVSYLYYADRVMEFPLGVFGIALATAALPSMAAQAARGERRPSRYRELLVATLGLHRRARRGRPLGARASHREASLPARRIHGGRCALHGPGAGRLCGGAAGLLDHTTRRSDLLRSRRYADPRVGRTHVRGGEYRAGPRAHVAAQACRACPRLLALRLCQPRAAVLALAPSSRRAGQPRNGTVARPDGPRLERAVGVVPVGGIQTGRGLARRRVDGRRAHRRRLDLWWRFRRAQSARAPCASSDLAPSWANLARDW